MADIAAWWEPLRAAAAAATVTADSSPQPPSAEAGFLERFAESLETVRLALHVYRPRELAISFNGGKDCTVILHLVRYVLHADGLAGETCARSGGLLGSPIQVVFFPPPPDAASDRFPEEAAFMAETAARHDFSLRELPGGARAGLETLASAGVRAVIMGTRGSDPHGAALSAFTPTSLSWPPAMRVNPILRWRYSDVWTFLRGAGLPACELYARGYTSIGRCALRAGGRARALHCLTPAPPHPQGVDVAPQPRTGPPFSWGRGRPRGGRRPRPAAATLPPGLGARRRRAGEVWARAHSSTGSGSCGSGAAASRHPCRLSYPAPRGARTAHAGAGAFFGGGGGRRGCGALTQSCSLLPRSTPSRARA